jgi:hypothetical protein
MQTETEAVPKPPAVKRSLNTRAPKQKSKKSKKTRVPRIDIIEDEEEEEEEEAEEDGDGDDDESENEMEILSAAPRRTARDRAPRSASAVDIPAAVAQGVRQGISELIQATRASAAPPAPVVYQTPVAYSVAPRHRLEDLSRSPVMARPLLPRSSSPPSFRALPAGDAHYFYSDERDSHPVRGDELQLVPDWRQQLVLREDRVGGAQSLWQRRRGRSRERSNERDELRRYERDSYRR